MTALLLVENYFYACYTYKCITYTQLKKQASFNFQKKKKKKKVESTVTKYPTGFKIT